MSKDSQATLGSAAALTGTCVVDRIGGRLASIGADVLRIEPPLGCIDRHQGLMVGQTSLDFAVPNAGRRSFTTPTPGISVPMWPEGLWSSALCRWCGSLSRALL